MGLFIRKKNPASLWALARGAAEPRVPRWDVWGEMWRWLAVQKGRSMVAWLWAGPWAHLYFARGNSFLPLSRPPK